MSSSTAPKKDVRTLARKSDEKTQAEPEGPVSVGGRKFRRQGNVWVDGKFKPSMQVINVSRGSSGFAELDSKIRSIAQELRGEVLVVWKGKAYRIR